jgi:hypothetical protein
MIGRRGLPRDPFEGAGAVQTHRRVRVESLIALMLAIAACGLTSAAWVLTLAQADRFPLT